MASYARFIRVLSMLALALGQLRADEQPARTIHRLPPIKAAPARLPDYIPSLQITRQKKIHTGSLRPVNFQAPIETTPSDAPEIPFELVVADNVTVWHDARLEKPIEAFKMPYTHLSLSQGETVYPTHGESAYVKGQVSGAKPDEHDVWVYVDNNQPFKGVWLQGTANPDPEFSCHIALPEAGRHDVYFRVMEKNLETGGRESTRTSRRLRILVQRSAPVIRGIIPENFTDPIGPYYIDVQVGHANPISDPIKRPGTTDQYDLNEQIKLCSLQAPDKSTDGTVAKLRPAQNIIRLTIADLPPGPYDLKISPELRDVFGNTLGQETKLRVLRPDNLPTQTAGISGSTGPYVVYPEFTKPRKKHAGFNPSDVVETRVARLYFYRDAHRVVQIINRKAKSFNRIGTDHARQLADQARGAADELTRQRRAIEQRALEAARQSRATERELQQAQNRADSARREAMLAARDFQRERRRSEEDRDATSMESLQDTFDVAQRVAQREDENVSRLRDEVDRLRAQEVALTQEVLDLEQKEELHRADQFRREVAAAKADPDTFAPGVPDSDDPVEQVSASVIGEGLIHLRGPLKGINVIRRAIALIDAPVGQVRIGIHTVQINGERGDRMEEVATQVERYLNHARFLTTQSSEMLRKSIVRCAANSAVAAGEMQPGNKQVDRDYRYLYSFFGRDFIDELYAMDSEFLKTGNKLLSLHSMHTTSLASALTVLALAKNDKRIEILQDFEGRLAGELQQAEINYFESSLHACPGKDCKKKCRCAEFLPLAQNARFESIKGLFNQQIGHPDVMTPLQREFIRLAQIFKAKLVTEMQYKQRVMERALIEERIGDEQAERLLTRSKERVAQERFDEMLHMQVQQQMRVREALGQLLATLRASFDEAKIGSAGTRAFDEAISRVTSRQVSGTVPIRGNAMQFYINPFDDSTPEIVFDFPVGTQIGTHTVGTLEVNQLLSEPGLHQERRAAAKEYVENYYNDAYSSIKRIYDEQISRYNFNEHRTDLLQVRRLLDELAPGKGVINDWRKLQRVAMMKQSVDTLIDEIGKHTANISMEAHRLIHDVSDPSVDISDAFDRWARLHATIRSSVNDRYDADRIQVVAAVDDAFQKLLSASSAVRAASQSVELARRPLDHKKFLDMLIDDLEDEYIELMEGTRAHTANIDNYIKKVATALEDDFNTQFYNPAFRCIRSASRYRDVTFGQTETTTVLANNREFAKVTPTATMEFDLPQRDIFVTEAMKGAKAAVDEYGALVTDPSFLALTSLGAGQSTASAFGNRIGGYSTERSLTSGLSHASQEQILSQTGGGRGQFGAAFENLIPDPAIYKFETGTGYELRPVIQPDGQAVVFDFNYMYTTEVREPVRVDEKHLGRIKRHFIDTDVQLSNYELRPVSRYQVALKASRTSRGVPLLEDIPVVGGLFRPLPQQESSLQQNLILAQATIYPTLFDLMGLRWAPAVTDLDPLRLANEEYIVRGRYRHLQNRVYDYSSHSVDDFLRTPAARRRADLYRTQESIPLTHPNGYQGRGLDFQESELRENDLSQPFRFRPSLGVPIQRESEEGPSHRIDRRPAAYRHGSFIGDPEPSYQGAGYDGSIDGMIEMPSAYDGGVSIAPR